MIGSLAFLIFLAVRVYFLSVLIFYRLTPPDILRFLPFQFHVPLFLDENRLPS